jgi:ketosteroid isomerase-like protein
MSSLSPADTVLAAIRAVENRDYTTLAALYDPNVEFHWPPSLPYSGDHKGPAVEEMSQRFAQTWVPLQPDEETRRMEPRVVATGDDGQVVVAYRWKGKSPDGRRFETDTLAEYHVRNGRLIRARMFYDDLTGMVEFLQHAQPLGGAASAGEPKKPAAK